MKSAPFRYRRPDSVAQALDWLGGPETKVIAGGQSLLPLMNLRLARPEELVDLNALPELERIIPDAESLLIGTLVRHRMLERDPVVASRVPLLAAAAAHIGHVGIRNRGTIGGSLCHADPAAELPLVAAILGATVYLESAGRPRRAVPARGFATSYFTTIAEPDELLTWIRVPTLRPGQGWGFVEFARRHGDFAMAGAAATVRLDAAGHIVHAAAGVMSVADTPVVLDTTGLLGRRPAAAELRGWALDACAILRPGQDPEFGRHLASVALTRTLADATRRATEASSNEQ